VLLAECGFVLVLAVDILGRGTGTSNSGSMLSGMTLVHQIGGAVICHRFSLANEDVPVRSPPTDIEAEHEAAGDTVELVHGNSVLIGGDYFCEVHELAVLEGRVVVTHGLFFGFTDNPP
jgi:hypothetical protein